MAPSSRCRCRYSSISCVPLRHCATYQMRPIRRCARVDQPHPSAFRRPRSRAAVDRIRSPQSVRVGADSDTEATLHASEPQLAPLPEGRSPRAPRAPSPDLIGERGSRALQRAAGIRHCSANGTRRGVVDESSVQHRLPHSLPGRPRCCSVRCASAFVRASSALRRCRGHTAKCTAVHSSLGTGYALRSRCPRSLL